MAKKGSPDDANPGGARSAAPFVPKTTSIRTLTAAAHECRGCDLSHTATQAVFGAGPGKAPRVLLGEQLELMANRGKVIEVPGPKGPGLQGPGLPVQNVVATIHPSAVLRAPDSEGRRAAYESLVADLKVVARALRSRT